MAAGDEIRVRGADEVARTLSAFADDIEDLADTGAEAAGLVQRAAQGFAPRRTGALRASITVARAEHGATVTAGVGIRRPYPSIQEYGSNRRGITAKRYMQRAGDQQEKPVADLYETTIDKLGNQVKGA